MPNVKKANTKNAAKSNCQCGTCGCQQSDCRCQETSCQCGCSQPASVR